MKIWELNITSFTGKAQCSSLFFGIYHNNRLVKYLIFMVALPFFTWRPHVCDQIDASSIVVSSRCVSCEVQRGRWAREGVGCPRGVSHKVDTQGVGVSHSAGAQWVKVVQSSNVAAQQFCVGSQAGWSPRWSSLYLPAESLECSLSGSGLGLLQALSFRDLCYLHFGGSLRVYPGCTVTGWESALVCNARLMFSPGWAQHSLAGACTRVWCSKV